VFPSPEQSWLSKLADVNNTNNITGFKNARADQIIEEYNKEFDFNKRVKLLQELDGIISNQHIAILEWTAPYERFVYWNKFGHPPGYLTRIGDIRDIPSMWWIDPGLSAKLAQALKDPSINMGEGPSEDKYWLDFDQKNTVSAPTASTR
jgi:microcin C transport system substrate-binding protein